MQQIDSLQCYGQETENSHPTIQNCTKLHTSCMLRYKLGSKNHHGDGENINPISSGCQGLLHSKSENLSHYLTLDSIDPLTCGSGYNCADYWLVANNSERECCCQKSFCNKKEHVMLTSRYHPKTSSEETVLNDQWQIVTLVCRHTYTNYIIM